MRMCITYEIEHTGSSTIYTKTLIQAKLMLLKCPVCINKQFVIHVHVVANLHINIQYLS